MPDAHIYAEIILLVRFLLMLVAGFNAAWCAPWIGRLFRGEHWPLSLVMAALFLISGASALLQIIVIMAWDNGSTSAVALLAFIALTAGHVALAMAHTTRLADRIIKLAPILSHVELCASLADLADFDHDAAQRVSDQTRNILIAKMMGGKIARYG